MRTVSAALVAAFLLGSGALAHDAGGGWAYPAACCSNRDCHRVSVDDLQENADGSWTYLPLRITFTRAMVKPSGNRWFHVCYHPKMLTPLCVFIIQGS